MNTNTNTTTSLMKQKQQLRGMTSSATSLSSIVKVEAIQIRRKQHTKSQILLERPFDSNQVYPNLYNHCQTSQKKKRFSQSKQLSSSSQKPYIQLPSTKDQYQGNLYNLISNIQKRQFRQRNNGSKDTNTELFQNSKQQAKTEISEKPNKLSLQTFPKKQFIRKQIIQVLQSILSKFILDPQCVTLEMTRNFDYMVDLYNLSFLKQASLEIQEFWKKKQNEKMKKQQKDELEKQIALQDENQNLSRKNNIQFGMNFNSEIQEPQKIEVSQRPQIKEEQNDQQKSLTIVLENKSSVQGSQNKNIDEHFQNDFYFEDQDSNQEDYITPLQLQQKSTNSLSQQPSIQIQLSQYKNLPAVSPQSNFQEQLLMFQSNQDNDTFKGSQPDYTPVQALSIQPSLYSENQQKSSVKTLNKSPRRSIQQSQNRKDQDQSEVSSIISQQELQSIQFHYTSKSAFNKNNYRIQTKFQKKLDKSDLQKKSQKSENSEKSEQSEINSYQQNRTSDVREKLGQKLLSDQDNFLIDNPQKSRKQIIFQEELVSKPEKSNSSSLRIRVTKEKGNKIINSENEQSKINSRGRLLSARGSEEVSKIYKSQIYEQDQEDSPDLRQKQKSTTLTKQTKQYRQTSILTSNQIKQIKKIQVENTGNEILVQKQFSRNNEIKSNRNLKLEPKLKNKGNKQTEEDSDTLQKSQKTVKRISLEQDDRERKLKEQLELLREERNLERFDASKRKSLVEKREVISNLLNELAGTQLGDISSQINQYKERLRRLSKQQSMLFVQIDQMVDDLPDCKDFVQYIIEPKLRCREQDLQFSQNIRIPRMADMFEASQINYQEVVDGNQEVMTVKKINDGEEQRRQKFQLETNYLQYLKKKMKRSELTQIPIESQEIYRSDQSQKYDTNICDGKEKGAKSSLEIWQQKLIKKVEKIKLLKEDDRKKLLHKFKYAKMIAKKKEEIM